MTTIRSNLKNKIKEAYESANNSNDVDELAEAISDSIIEVLKEAVFTINPNQIVTTNAVIGSPSFNINKVPVNFEEI